MSIIIIHNYYAICSYVHVHSQLHACMVSMQRVMYRFVETTLMQSRRSLKIVPQLYSSKKIQAVLIYAG